MSKPDTLGAFFRDNKTLLKEYIETRLQLYRLQTVRVFSKSAGHVTWIIVALFLGFLILLFGGLVMGFWLSGLMHSFVQGFGLTTIFLMLLFAIVVFFRNKLFVNPIIETIIRNSGEMIDEENKSKTP